MVDSTYLENRLDLRPGTYHVSELGGGVSNTVLLIEAPGRRMVLKQSLGKLRVDQDWFSDPKRIWREAEAIRLLGQRLQSGSVPEVLFEDRENFVYAMSAAPADALPWKTILMRGEASLETAETIGQMLGCIYRISRDSAEYRETFGDQTVFDELRLDPYYRTTALRHPDLREYFGELVESCSRETVCLVHGDWSPKNFLVSGSQVMAIDFEVIHYGNPAFDSAFLLNHLVLKSFYLPQYQAALAQLATRFWDVLIREMGCGAPAYFESSTLRHLAGLLLARIDGKSPAEYIKEEHLKQTIRSFARDLMVAPPESVRDLFENRLRCL